jgi:hypothetical protein
VSFLLSFACRVVLTPLFLEDIQRWNLIMSGTSTEQTDFILHLVKHAFGEQFLESDASWQSADLLPTFNALKATV